jgi:dolichol-phosphate mannosyltransferase
MDADNSHMPGQILQMTRNIREGRDVVIASRFRPGAVVLGVPLYRRCLSLGVLAVSRICFPIRGVRDYSCGYRAYRADLLKQAITAYGENFFQREGGFACMIGVLLRLKKLGAVFGEIPIVLRYDQKQGLSKMKIASTVYHTLRVLLRERFSR